MSIYSIIYLILATVIMVVVIVNRLDLLCVCSVCFVVYSIYCIPGIGISGFYRPQLSPALYFYVYLQMIFIISFILIVRRREHIIKLHSKGHLFSEEVNENKTVTKAFYIYTIIMFGFMLFNVIKAGWAVFSSGKELVWRETNILYLISLYGAYPSFAYGVRYHKKTMWIASILIELSIFFAGSRAFLATMFIILLCELGYRLWKRKKKCISLYALGMVAVVFLLIYRAVDTYVMRGDISGALQVLGMSETWQKALEFNEPRVIIANYDYVLTTKTFLPIGDVIYRIIDFVPGLTKIIPIQLSFPEYFSTWLQEEVHGSMGVGGTFWGESYAMFGILGIPLVTMIWLLFVKKCNDHLAMRKVWSPFMISAGVHLAWYINRLDYNRVGQVLKVMLLCFIIWAGIFILLGGSIKFGKIKIALRSENNKIMNENDLEESI